MFPKDYDYQQLLRQLANPKLTKKEKKELEETYKRKMRRENGQDENGWSFKDINQV